MGLRDKEINLIRTYLKQKLQKEVFYNENFEKWHNIRNVLNRTSEGESNSMIIIGPRGCGKTALINSILDSLKRESDFVKNAIVVHLNGLIETDDKLALKSITQQLNLIHKVDGKVFGSFAENLSFLLSCLSNSENTYKSKSVIFILEEFDLFCHHHGQTLLYNLFDISQSDKVPVCVLGLTCRLDVIELLEKRVKSRYSHRQTYLFNDNLDSTEAAVDFFKEYLHIKDCTKDSLNKKSLKNTQCYIPKFSPLGDQFNFSSEVVKSWNKSMDEVLSNTTVQKCIEELTSFSLNPSFLKQFIFRLVSTLNIQHQFLKPDDFLILSSKYNQDDKIPLLIGLSVLEICLIISMKHHCEIYDYDPFNFEIIFGRFTKFASKSTVMQSVDRVVALKAFEHIKSLELIIPINSISSKIKKEFQMHKLVLTLKQINQCINSYPNMPTEVSQWAKCSLI